MRTAFKLFAFIPPVNGVGIPAHLFAKGLCVPLNVADKSKGVLS
jgi:hypothetical protein